MKEKELFDLYEKLYFHEIEMRDRLNGRLQISLILLLTLGGFLAFMLRRMFFTAFSLPFTIFLILYLLATISAVLAIVFFIRSWQGHEYALLPSAERTEEYRRELIKAYGDFSDHENLIEKYMRQYLYKYYIECSSINTEKNDQKSYKLHLANKFIISSVILAIIAFIPFYFGGLDSSSAPQAIRIIEPI